MENIDKEAYGIVDDKFHKLLAEYSNNNILNRLYTFGSIYTKVVQAGLVRAPIETYKEHIDLIEAIKKKNIELAEVLICNHIRLSGNLLSEQHCLEKKPNKTLICSNKYRTNMS